MRAGAEVLPRTSGVSTVASVGLKEMAERNLLNRTLITSGLALSSSSAIREAWG